MIGLRFPGAALVMFSLVGNIAARPDRVPVEIEIEPIAGARAYQVQVERAGQLELNQKVEPGKIQLFLAPGIVWIRVAAVNKLGKPDSWTPWREMRVGLPPGPQLESVLVEAEGSLLVRGLNLLPETEFRLLREGRPVPVRIQLLDRSTVRLVPAALLERGSYQVVAITEDARLSLPVEVALAVPRGPCRVSCPPAAIWVPGLPSYLRWEYGDAARWGGSFVGLLAAAAIAESGRQQVRAAAKRDVWLRLSADPGSVFLARELGWLDQPLALYYWQKERREHHAAREATFRNASLVALPAALFVFGWHAKVYHDLQARLQYEPEARGGRFTGMLSITY